MPSGPRAAAPSGGKRERTKAENRDAILAAARGVFADLGYETATIRDVIGATNLAAGTFYNYFPDKESVLRALLADKILALRTRARQARAGATSVEEIVRSVLVVSFTMVGEDPELFGLMQRNSGAIRAIYDEPSFLGGLDDLRTDLTRALRAAGAARVDAEYLTAAISGLAFEIAAVAVDRGPHALASAADFAADLVLGGISRVAKAGTTGNRSSRIERPRRTTPRAADAVGPRRARKHP